MAEVHEHMTFSYTPTIICKDRDGVSFALKLKLDLRTEKGKEGYGGKKLKKGCVVSFLVFLFQGRVKVRVGDLGERNANAQEGTRL